MNNIAKLFSAYVELSGNVDSAVIAEDLGVPIRTVQRWLKDARNGGAKSGANAKTDAARNGVLAPKVAHQQKENSPTPPKRKINNITTTTTNSESEDRSDADVVDYGLLSRKLIEAGGEALKNDFGEFEVVALPLAWIEAGASLERDIIPTIRRVVAKKPPRSITSYKYFQKAVFQAMRDVEEVAVAAKAAADAQLSDGERYLNRLMAMQQAGNA